MRNKEVIVADQLADGYDAVVIGGGAAGLNGALMLARARRSVLVIDAGEPRNAPAEGVHGLLAREGMAPAELVARGREEVRGYGGQVVSGMVVNATRDADTPAGGEREHAARDGGTHAGGTGAESAIGFTVELADGRSVRARRLLVTTGLVDELPNIEGLRERWGHDVIHCPYCHGWEVRDQAIGILGSGPMSVHQALLFRQWSPDITYFAHSVAPTAEQAEQLAARGISVVTGAVKALEIADDKIVGVRLEDGTVVPRSAVAVASRMVARANFLAALDLKPADHPSGMGEHIPADPTGRTDAPGIWVAGNVTDLSAQVGAAAAAGATAGAMINFDLVNEETAAAVAAYRART
ncbi:NAD(P)/FAD-dependent oxidoreductase [Nocardia sp. NBC_01503]|uniref:NAD(P)/FAD-dependent oxidoreductase n=1 Tax=Nocardia sp. NBC_01503 TaxID=2975997 RepID=UPI002E7B757D|nr:NAD(P)/FAD-dependent oxidoreductase [Nocardia sp. NBC_01503]WTL32217.1 NAD(P)/FAD-dependent oxidoreductase [Nocardia sp. NBC_01503]